MLDLKFVRENPGLVKAGAEKKRIPCDVDRVIELDAVRREVGVRVDDLRSRQKAAGKSISKASPEEREGLLAEQKELKDELKGLEERLSAAQSEMETALLRIPNVPSEEVPDGADDTDNVELRKVGEPTRFGFDPFDHVELGSRHDWLDVEAGARLAGSRNYVLKGDLALLENAVMRFALDHMVAKGFTPLSVPVLVRADPLLGTGFFPGGEDQTYATDERDDLYLVGTSEVPVTSLHAGEILSLDKLPLRYVAWTSCFRREAGTYGKDTRGLYRVHQFQKVEQVVLDVADEARSVEHHRSILGNSEELLQAFELPYRVVNVCGGDLGSPQVQKFDIETWMPGRENYGETHSASRFHDYQARRLKLRYRDEDKKTRFCHTLNNTVAASTRLLIALLENHQQEDGRIGVPPALRSYLGGRETLGSAVR
ncbi:MAG: serine--tRNA ligase [Planctomycetota bacterium]